MRCILTLATISITLGVAAGCATQSRASHSPQHWGDGDEATPESRHDQGSRADVPVAARGPEPVGGDDPPAAPDERVSPSPRQASTMPPMTLLPEEQAGQTAVATQAPASPQISETRVTEAGTASESPTKSSSGSAADGATRADGAAVARSEPPAPHPAGPTGAAPVRSAETQPAVAGRDREPTAAGAGNARSPRDKALVSLLGRTLGPLPPGPERTELETLLTSALDELAKAPEDPERIVLVARRLGALWQMREAIDLLTRGISVCPDYAPYYRHRGHRYISIREFDLAVADLRRGVELIRGRPDELEAALTPPSASPQPGVAPGSGGRASAPGGASGSVPTTLGHSMYYHLGIAHYMKGQYEDALAAFREAGKRNAGRVENRIGALDWSYMCLRRLGRDAEADALIADIGPGLDVSEGRAYYRRLLLYKGVLAPAELRDPVGVSGLDLVTQSYGVANWYWCNGARESAQALFRSIVESEYWPAFGFIASEVEIARMEQAAK
jgi:tetratricopeptide (TPR) repeat protein